MTAILAFPMEISMAHGNFQVLEISRAHGNFHGPWKIPWPMEISMGGPISPWTGSATLLVAKLWHFKKENIDGSALFSIQTSGWGYKILMYNQNSAPVYKNLNEVFTQSYLKEISMKPFHFCLFAGFHHPGIKFNVKFKFKEHPLFCGKVLPLLFF